MGHRRLSVKENWWVADPRLTDEIREALVGPYTTLALRVMPDAVSVAGTFPIVHDSEILDRYEIEITFPRTYPDDPPSVRETTGRIPHTADRHNSSGAACLFFPIEWKLRRPDNAFDTFLLGPVHSYFLGQSLVEAGQPWPFGERKHGIDGAIEALRDILGLASDDQARAALWTLSKATIKGHWDCPCGSGRRLRACHGPTIWRLSTPNNTRWVRETISSYVISTCDAEKFSRLKKKRQR